MLNLNNSYYIAAIAALTVIIIVVWMKMKAKNELINTLADCYDQATFDLNELRKRV